MGHRRPLKSKRAASALDHELLRLWRERCPQSATILVAVSGGADSMFLLDFLYRWKQLLKLDLIVAHVHHGRRGSPAQTRFRDRAAALVTKWCDTHGVRLLSNVTRPTAPRVQSEASLRQFRWAWLEKWRRALRKEGRAPVWVATAHTADDLLETQLMRLMRGTGPQGLRAMSVVDGEVLRPLLEVTKAKLLAAAKLRRLKWCNDPSNRSVSGERVWLRKVWLGALDRRDPGARMRLAASLRRVTEALDAMAGKACESAATGQSLDRRQILRLPLAERRQAVAKFLHNLGLADYSRGHIEEILKRLDNRRGEQTFRLLGRDWLITPDRVALRQE